MDLAKLDVVAGANAGFDLQLMHPVSGKNLPLFIRVLGADSNEYEAADIEENRKRVDDHWKGGQFRANSEEPDEAKMASIRRLVAVTKDWWELLADKSKRNTFEVRGEFIACSPSAAEQLYKDHPWIREQVFLAINNRANFIKG